MSDADYNEVIVSLTVLMRALIRARDCRPAAVERAFQEGYSHGFVNAGGRGGDVESARFDSSAKAALQGAGEGG